MVLLCCFDGHFVPVFVFYGLGLGSFFIFR